MALSKPRGTFTHQQTVLLIIEDFLGDIDAVKIVKTLQPLYSAISGVLPKFSGKCFDITLKSCSRRLNWPHQA